MLTQFQHDPVLLDEVLVHLQPEPGSVILDGTLGAGGHATAILARTGPEGILVGLDQDPEALRAAQTQLAPFGDRTRLVRASFRELDQILAGEGLDAIDGVLFDLGVSSHQIDEGAASALHRAARRACSRSST